MDKKRGVSLIVLIITIVVMMIVAIATIFSFTNTDVKGEADKAKFQTNITTFYQQLQEYIGNKRVEATMAGNIYNPDTAAELNYVTGSNLVNFIPQIKARYYNSLAIVKGKLIYTGTNEDEKEWAKDSGVDSSYISDGLLLYLDSANTNSYSGSGNTIYDLSINKKVGTLSNGALYSAANKKSISLDGSNDIINIPHNYNLDTTGEWTFSAWIYPTMNNVLEGYGRTIFSTSTTIGNFGSWILLNGNNIRVHAFTTSTGAYAQTTSGKITINHWNNITVTAKKAQNIKIYINGSLDFTGSAGSNSTVTSEMYIGDLRLNRLLSYGGNINDILFYNRVLTDAEILSSYNLLSAKYN